jgi:hypothetical protein
MIVYIHSHEIDDQGVTFGRHAAVRDVCHIIVPKGSSVPTIVGLVTAQVSEQGSIWTLIFNGHGDDARSGDIFFGLWIHISDVAQFSPLAAYMNQRGGGVEMHCCRGSREFIQAMSNTFNVRVIGGSENQSGVQRAIPFVPPLYAGSPFTSDSVGVIEGPEIICYPQRGTSTSR